MWTTASRSIYDPYHKRTVKYRIAQPVCDDANYAAELGWPLLGIVGNEDHWMKDEAGDHTSRSTDEGKHGEPKPGWVYADDIRVPDSKVAAVRDAILRLARGGKLPQLKYFNIGNRHYSWKTGFKRYSWSPDKHLHTSYEPTYETAAGKSVLRAALEDDVSAKDVWTYDPGDNSGIENRPWRPDHKTNRTVRPSFAVEQAWDEAHEANERSKRIEEKVDNLAVGGVDIDALANRVADLLADRLAA